MCLYGNFVTKWNTLLSSSLPGLESHTFTTIFSYFSVVLVRYLFSKILKFQDMFLLNVENFLP